MESIASWLKEKCKMRHLSLREAGDKAGLSHTTIQVYMRGGRPSLISLKKLSNAFEGDINLRPALEDELFMLAGYKTRPPITEPSDPMLKSTVSFWENALVHSKFLMSPSTQVFVGHTVGYLKELQRVRQ